MTLLDRQKELTGYLIAGYPDLGLPGLPLVSASAGTGNSTQENECLPVTTGPKDHGSDGLFQWREERLAEMQSWCTAHFGDWKTIKAQAAFFLKELRDGDAGGVKYDALYRDLLAGKKSLATLTTNINRFYERSADDEATNNKRIKYATDALNAMGVVKPAPPVVHSAAPAIVAGAAAGAGLLSHIVHGAAWIGIAVLAVAIIAAIAAAATALRQAKTVSTLDSAVADLKAKALAVEAAKATTIASISAEETKVAAAKAVVAGVQTAPPASAASLPIVPPTPAKG
ncbi:hypothetical protein MPC4_80131 [Methylocella tundrae]|uniref:Phage tail lysozyme domain-containing protein n=1 Tax=Methylocella tundrae TaxID=227605 RepID=A0A8B6MBT1_METTU|nr:phage tail tip lysozyme [Methylocella tundrae]VTZ24348.1 hypothetical protein MPC1_170006 [Methylocella tundrae]VTZ52460.1 hypothetical protein MPC4_80131 [Methylocella tundrae]